MTPINWQSVSPEITRILEKGAAGIAISESEASRLLSEATEGSAWQALCAVADKRRAELVGETITYVVNRNLNFTNICVYDCKFCSFAQSIRSEAAKNETLDELLLKADAAVRLGATEACIQGGINPKLGPQIYEDILVALRGRFPGLHLHAYSPFEIWYGAKKTQRSAEAYLKVLRDAGLNSLPGTAAEILVDAVREVIAPEKLMSAEWIAIIKTAHRLDIPTSATIMFGHVETAAHRARHLGIIREIQGETGGFTELVPLPFVHEMTPLYQQGIVLSPITLNQKLA